VIPYEDENVAAPQRFSKSLKSVKILTAALFTRKHPNYGVPCTYNVPQEN
jgi:hypothetical protein